MDINSYFANFNRGDYQKDNFDDFLHDVGFSFKVTAIHIAGTNGKGSVANYLNNIYIQAGYKTGIFTTPDDFNETIRINDKPIEDSYVQNLIEKYNKKFKKHELSSFEIHTFIALSYLADNNVDIAIIECGMGGEFDATNISTPVLSIITSISIEHSAFLGDSISEIAMHKAGIIKDYVPVLSPRFEGDALEIILSKIKSTASKYYVLNDYNSVFLNEGGYSFGYKTHSGLHIKSHALYSVKDACLAIEATEILKEVLPVNEENLKKGLDSMFIKCRFEVFNKNGKTIVIDGGHNPEAIITLRNDMDAYSNGRRIDVVFASFKDKNIISMLPELSLLGNVQLTTFDHERARTEDDYFLFLSEYSFDSDYKHLIDSLINNEDSDIILITGSLAFAYEVRKEMF